MVTNLVCKLIVVLVTNVLPSNNAHTTSQMEQHGDYAWSVPVYVPATEQYVTTNIERVASLTYVYEGTTNTVEIERKLLSSVTKILKLKQEWEDAGVRTNATDLFLKYSPDTWIILTNSDRILMSTNTAPLHSDLNMNGNYQPMTKEMK